MAQPALRTPRLTLVPPADEHLDLEVEVLVDPEVMRYITGRASARDEVEQAHKRRLTTAREAPGMGLWVGFAGDKFIGWWVLRPPNGPDHPKVATPNSATGCCAGTGAAATPPKAPANSSATASPTSA